MNVKPTLIPKLFKTLVGFTNEKKEDRFLFIKFKL